MKTPQIKTVSKLLSAIKRDICEEYMDIGDESPNITVTIGANDKGQWDYQTGDNSFSGAAYLYPHWAVVTLFRDSNCLELARDVKEQILDLTA